LPAPRFTDPGRRHRRPRLRLLHRVRPPIVVDPHSGAADGRGPPVRATGAGAQNSSNLESARWTSRSPAVPGARSLVQRVPGPGGPAGRGAVQSELQDDRWDDRCAGRVSSSDALRGARVRRRAHAGRGGRVGTGRAWPPRSWSRRERPPGLRFASFVLGPPNPEAPSPRRSSAWSSLTAWASDRQNPWCAEGPSSPPENHLGRGPDPQRGAGRGR
jgi:hypothetical protein